MLQKVIDAFKFALEKHSGQLRKDNSTPYIVHPFRVFMFLADKSKVYNEQVLAAAFLHDVLEDTKTDYDDLRKEFGEEIADMVADLTKDKRLPEKKRERTFNEKLANANWKVKIIKLADIYDNVSDMKNWKGKSTEKLSKLRQKREQLKFISKNLSRDYERIVQVVLKKINQMEKSLAR